MEERIESDFSKISRYLMTLLPQKVLSFNIRTYIYIEIDFLHRLSLLERFKNDKVDRQEGHKIYFDRF